MAIITTCTIALALLAQTNTTEQMSVCIQVVSAAEERGLPLELVAALSWHESRFQDNVVSKANAVGPLQILEKFWCKTDPCNHIESGLDAIEWYIKKSRDYTHAICRYNAGRCTKLSSRWSKKVLKTARALAEKSLTLMSF